MIVKFSKLKKATEDWEELYSSKEQYDLVNFWIKDKDIGRLKSFLEEGNLLTESQVDEMMKTPHFFHLLMEFDLPYNEDQRQKIILDPSITQKALEKWGSYLRKDTLEQLLLTEDVSISRYLFENILTPTMKNLKYVLRILKDNEKQKEFLFAHADLFPLPLKLRVAIIDWLATNPIPSQWVEMFISRLVNSERLRKIAFDTQNAFILIGLINNNLIHTQEEKQICLKHPKISVIFAAIGAKFLQDKENIKYFFKNRTNNFTELPEQTLYLIAALMDSGVDIPLDLVTWTLDKIEVDFSDDVQEKDSSAERVYRIFTRIEEMESLPDKGVLPPALQKAFSELRSFLFEKKEFVAIAELRKQTFFNNPQIKQYLLKEHPKGLSFTDLKFDFQSDSKYKIMFGTFPEDVQSLSTLRNHPRRIFVLLFSDIAGQLGLKGDVGFQDFQENILSQLKHDTHDIGVPGKTFGWALFKEIGENVFFIEQIQTDLLRLMDRIKGAARQSNMQQAWENLVAKYGEEKLTYYQNALNKAVKDYFSIILSAFLQEHRGADIYISSPEIIAQTVIHDAPKFEYKQIPPKFNFKLLPEFKDGNTPLPVWYKHNAKLRKLSVVT